MTNQCESERGFMLIELLVAVLVLSVGLIAVVAVLGSARRLVNVGERQDALVQVAQRQLEWIISLPYRQIALAADPSCSPYPADPNNSPNLGVSGCPSGPFSFLWDGVNAERIVVDRTNGRIAPVSTVITPTATGGTRLTLYIYSYVTAATDPSCFGCSTGSSSENYKRITVAVTSNPPETAAKQAIVISAIASDPCVAAQHQNATCLVP